MNSIATICLLALANAGDCFVDTLINQDNDELVHNLTFGTWDGNYAEDKYGELLFDATLNLDRDDSNLHDAGRDFILSENGSEAPYDWSEKRYYDHCGGPGVWCHESEKSGCVKTFIPARELVTESYTTECEEGVVKECYCEKA